MKIQFTKMHGLGNDFMVIDGIRQSIALTPEIVCALANRNTGIGFDQCLIIEAPTSTDTDFFYRIYNADGSEVGQCGNGARCLARFVERYGLTHKKMINVATATTRMSLQLNSNATVTVDMGHPHYELASTPNSLIIDNIAYEFHTLNLGNPHAVLMTNDINQAPVQTIGKQLSQHSFFPEQCNIGFMQLISPTHIKLRVYERGTGETQACGSGAVAAMAIGKLYHALAKDVTVSLPGGDLNVLWPENQASIYLTGDATFVYEGDVFL